MWNCWKNEEQGIKKLAANSEWQQNSVFIVQSKCKVSETVYTCLLTLSLNYHYHTKWCTRRRPTASFMPIS